MSLFSSAFILVAGVCFSFGFLHLLIFSRRRDLKEDLFFSLLAFSIAFSSIFELWAFHADSLATHISLLKGTLFIQLILWICFTWFIHYYTKSTIIWPPAVITILYSAALIINFFSAGSILFQSVQELTPFALSLNETIYYANGPANPLRFIGDVAWFILLGYAAFASFLFGKKSKNKNKAKVFGLTIFLCLGLGYLHGTLIDLGLADPPYLGSFLFLPLSLVMSYSLAGNVVNASRLSAEIKIAESRWRQLLENVHLIVLGVDTKHNIFYANRFFIESSGYEEAEVIGQPFLKILPDTERAQLSSRMKDVISKHSKILPERTLPILTKDGEKRTILWSNVMLENNEHENQGILTIGKDITEQLNAERSRDLALEQLEALRLELEKENISLRELIQLDHGFEEIVGESNELLYVLNKVQQVAQTDATVLIQGETGTGKELIARAIHKESKRNAKPFIRVNCAAIPADLVENELFGHEPGAFTNALSLRRGKFEYADGGVILLDEISELPLDAQAKLLNVLQERVLDRVGGGASIPIDVHVIAVTNRDLAEEVNNGRFRADLYYRLNVYPITVPPLRNRKEDIPLLVKHYISFFNKKFGKNVENIPPFLLEKMQQYDWPGNVRELRNLIERAIILCDSNSFRLPSEALLLQDAQNGNLPMDRPDEEAGLLSLAVMERRHIFQVLQKTNWKVSGTDGAASILKMNPSTLRSRIKKHRLEKP